MPTARVSRGRKTQELLAEYLKHRGFPNAESRPASLPGEDILNTGLVSFEVKATEGQDFTGALRQAIKNMGGGEYPVVVYRPRGYGPEKINDWIAAMPLAYLISLLQDAGLTDVA